MLPKVKTALPFSYFCDTYWFKIEQKTHYLFIIQEIFVYQEIHFPPFLRHILFVLMIAVYLLSQLDTLVFPYRQPYGVADHL